MGPIGLVGPSEDSSRRDSAMTTFWAGSWTWRFPAFWTGWPLRSPFLVARDHGSSPRPGQANQEALVLEFLSRQSPGCDHFLTGLGRQDRWEALACLIPSLVARWAHTNKEAFL